MNRSMVPVLLSREPFFIPGLRRATQPPDRKSHPRQGDEALARRRQNQQAKDTRPVLGLELTRATS